MRLQNRRTFLKHSSQTALGLGLLGLYACGNENANSAKFEGHDHNHNHRVENDKGEKNRQNEGELFFQISLAQWSLNKEINGGKMDNLDFASIAKKEFGIHAIEYVNQFFKDKAQDKTYLGEMKKRAADNGVKSLLIMVDGEGDLGNLNDKERQKAVNNHLKWLEAAQFLGCHSIRVNAFGEGKPGEVGKAAIDGLGNLSNIAANYGLNVLVENHGSYSSDGKWLSNVMTQVNRPNCGTLPDFGNFCIQKSGPGFWEGDCLKEYDRYQGVTELMPFAKAVSAKTHDFDENGNEIHSDYRKMLQIVKNAGYTGYIGIEYEGEKVGAFEGIRATKKLLEKVGRQLS